MDETWLLRAHSWSRLHDWVRRLRHTRFVRAVGGHANDGDYLALALRWEGEEDLRHLMARLGAPLGASLPGTSTVPGHPHLAQPGHVVVLGLRAFAWVRGDRVEIRLSGADGRAHEVSEADVLDAEALEGALGDLASRVVDPPVDTDRVVTPLTFPELFADDD